MRGRRIVVGCLLGGAALDTASYDSVAALRPGLDAAQTAWDADARRRTADLSWGRFDRKWGALAAGLWLEAEASGSPDALEAFVAAGAHGVWALASRHPSADLVAPLDESRAPEALSR